MKKILVEKEVGCRNTGNRFTIVHSRNVWFLIAHFHSFNVKKGFPRWFIDTFSKESIYDQKGYFAPNLKLLLNNRKLKEFLGFP